MNEEYFVIKKVECKECEDGTRRRKVFYQGSDMMEISQCPFCEGTGKVDGHVPFEEAFKAVLDRQESEMIHALNLAMRG